MTGLQDAGWRGDTQKVRLGYTAAMALRRMAMIGYMLPMILDEKQHAPADEIVRLPLGEFGDRVGRVGEFVETLTAEARRLIV